MLVAHGFYFLTVILFENVVNASGNSHKCGCRAQPGDHSFPKMDELGVLNSSVDGRLIHVVPTGQFCKGLPGGCSDDEWADSVFRSNIPGSMLQPNWEQDYLSDPPSLCFRNTSFCGQGSVPVYAVNATTAAHIQAGVRFAQAHNLKVAIKASGHDYLGRSTAKGSLLLWTRYFQNITFHDSFYVGDQDKGSVVTVGSGVGLHTIYQATKARGKIFVGGSAGNVVAAGGYVQGAGHSPLGPLFGMAADNALEFQVVLADGSLVIANDISNPDLFWALRGGGAGSWGVIISVTLRTFPTFDVVWHRMSTTMNSSAAVGELATLHAQHIFDWDAQHVGQYFYVEGVAPELNWFFDSYFPDTSIATANASLAPFMDAAAARGYPLTLDSVTLQNANDAISPLSSDSGGDDIVLGSRLIPADVYRHNFTAVGETYQKVIDAGGTFILGSLVAGGKVSKIAVDSSAINPKWRTAKTHVVLVSGWLDSTPAGDVEAIREDLTNNQMPLLDALAGPGSGSYSNEADVREPDFRSTFFGTHYFRLSAIKEAYDPHGLFIVGAGVGSEKWDVEGLCRLDCTS